MRRHALNLGDLTKRLRGHKTRMEDIETALSSLEDEELPEFILTDTEIEIEIEIDEATTYLRGIITETNAPVKLRTFFGTFIERIAVGDTEINIEYSRNKMLNQGGFSLVHSKGNWLLDLGSNQGPTD